MRAHTEADQPTRSSVVNKTDMEESAAFYVSPENGHTVPGPGSLDTLLVVGDSPDFGVFIETEDSTFVDESFDSLSTYSDYLDHITAEVSGSDHNLVVNNVPYRESMRVQIRPTSGVSFSRVRAVFTIGREIDY